MHLKKCLLKCGQYTNKSYNYLRLHIQIMARFNVDNIKMQMSGWDKLHPLGNWLNFKIVVTLHITSSSAVDIPALQWVELFPPTYSHLNIFHFEEGALWKKNNEMHPAVSLQHFIKVAFPNICCAVDFINRTKQGVVQTFVLVIGCLGDQKA